MDIRLVASTLLIGWTGPATLADDNPYANAKVGDCVTYKLTVRFDKTEIGGTISQTITSKSDKEVIIRTTGKICLEGSNSHIPEREHKLDPTKPFDPTLICGELAAGTDAKLVRGKEGTERLNIGGKDYTTSWITYKVNANAMGQAVETDLKVWMTKDSPIGLVKLTMAGDVGGQKIDLTLELMESGKKEYMWSIAGRR